MARVVVCGSGMVGLGTAMLLAKDGHAVTVLERDPAPVPDPSEAWERWERRGITQFRLPHFLAGRFAGIVDRELPEVGAALDAAGALRFDFIANIPDEATGGPRPDDSALVAITARRPVAEAALAAAAERSPGVTVRRGSAVAGLRTGAPACPGVPHVTGVELAAGESLDADLVIDAMGRRSPLPAWLGAAGGRAPIEESEDSGFMYYGRHFRSPTGEMPVLLGPLIQDYGSVSVLTLPADNGTWSVVLVTSARDAALRPLRAAGRWTATVASMPLVAHWIDGEPLDDGVATMAKIEDRRRFFVVDGRPVVTGLLAVGDAWACTNPSLGRGASIGLVHAVALRELLATVPLGDPLALAAAWSAATERTVGPWYEGTNRYDRHRLAEAEAVARDEPYETDDPEWDFVRCLADGAGKDPDLLRAFVAMMSVLRTPQDLRADRDLSTRARALGAGWRDEPSPGPTRAELLATVAG